jgi:hypothetical protein
MKKGALDGGLTGGLGGGLLICREFRPFGKRLQGTLA